MKDKVLKKAARALKPKRLHGARFYKFVRRRTAHALVHEHGMDWAAAREEADEITDDEIDEQTRNLKMGAIGDGSFLRWIAEHKDQIIRIITALISLIAIFATKPKAAN